MLRQKLMEREEEQGQLERKATELSATVSSTLASYAFLEQALAAETTKYKPIDYPHLGQNHSLYIFKI